MIVWADQYEIFLHVQQPADRMVLSANIVVWSVGRRQSSRTHPSWHGVDRLQEFRKHPRIALQ